MKNKIIIGFVTIAICLTSFLSYGSLQISAVTAPTAKVVDLDPQNRTCALSANIMKNANWNFESNEDYWNLINTIDNMGSAYFYVMAITDEKPYSGKYSLQLDGIGGWSNIIIPLNVKKNTNYTFSMWVNAAPGLGGATGSVFKIGQVTSHDIAKIPAQDWFSGTLGFEYDSKWHQTAVTVNSGDNDELAIVIADGGGTLYFDEMRFFETANPNGVAATEPSNLQNVINEYKRRADEAKSKASSASSSKAASSGAISTTTSTSIQDSSQTSVDSSISQSNESSSDVSSTEAVSGNNSTPAPVTPQNNTLVYILIGIIVLLIGGGFAAWFFKFRKK